MVINENIFKGRGNFLDNDYRNYNNSEIVKIEDKTLYAKSVDIALFYISIDTSDFDAEIITISADIGNRGGIPLYIQINGVARGFNEKLVNPGESFKLEHTTELRDKYLVLRICGKESGDIGLYYRNIKIEKGEEATPYIPNKNNLDPSKQAIFKAGGGIPRGVSTLIGLGVGYVS